MDCEEQGEAAMQASEDNGPGGAAAGAPGQGGTGGPGGPRGPGDPGVAGQGGATTGGVPLREQAAQAPGPDGAAAPGAGSSARPEFQFTFNVPFLTSVEAQIARHFLMLHVEDGGPVQKSFCANGNILTVRLMADRPDQLHNATSSCIDYLCLLVRILLDFLSAPFATPEPGQRG